MSDKYKGMSASEFLMAFHNRVKERDARVKRIEAEMDERFAAFDRGEAIAVDGFAKGLLEMEQVLREIDEDKREMDEAIAGLKTEVLDSLDLMLNKTVH